MARPKSDQIPIGQIKWTTKLTCDTLDWKFCYSLSDKCKKEARASFFQYQIPHRTIMTDKKIHQFNLRKKRSLRCVSRSGNHITSLIWLPYGDEFLARNWKMLSQNFTSTIYLDKISVLIGNPRNEHVVNALMIITKHEIFNVSVKALLSILDIWSQYLKSTYKLRFIWVQSRTSWPKCLENGLPFTMFWYLCKNQIHILCMLFVKRTIYANGTINYKKTV